MTWEKGTCPLCGRDAYIGYVECMELKVCVDCFLAWQDGKLIVKTREQESYRCPN